MTWNLPNSLTVGRIFLTFIFVALAAVSGMEPAPVTTSSLILRWIAYLCGIVAGLTDFADGYLARKWNQVSDFGALMDPLADKIFATATMILLVEFDFMPGWMAVVVLSREFLVTGLRTMALKSGRVIKADRWGKCKTALQMTAVAIAGAAWIGLFDIREKFFGDVHLLWILWQVILYLVVLVTLGSGCRYFWCNRDLILTDAPKKA